jgi:hypothetical protein
VKIFFDNFWLTEDAKAQHCLNINKAELMAITDPTRMATKEEMAELQTIPMFESLPIDPEYIALIEARKELRKKLKEERHKFGNVFSIQLNRLMNHFKIEAAPLAKATGIPESTLHGWVNFIVRIQETDSNLASIANYFDVTINFLCYATPKTDRDIELEDIMPDLGAVNDGRTA